MRSASCASLILCSRRAGAIRFLRRVDPRGVEQRAPRVERRATVASAVGSSPASSIDCRMHLRPIWSESVCNFKVFRGASIANIGGCQDAAEFSLRLGSREIRAPDIHQESENERASLVVGGAGRRRGPPCALLDRSAQREPQNEIVVRFRVEK
jgi:hypothetical protein